MSAHNDGLPDDPAGVELMIHALVDGELDAAAALAVERRIAADPALAAEHARIVALQSAVGRLALPQVSDALNARIAAIGATGEAQARPAPTRPPQTVPTHMRPTQTRPGRFGAFDWRAMAASILVTAVLASGVTQWVMLSGAPDSFAAAVASGHRRSLLAASPVDVVSSDRHTVKPWLDGRVGLSPPAPDLASDGFALLGGRVEVIADQPVPALVYRHREHLITLVAAPEETGSTAGPVDLSAGGFSLVHWSDSAFSYWAISDVERPELDDFVNRFRAAATR
ncbi:anti-sigma factor [Mesorhizobium sp. M0684]|uniref:anti-sigma factor family protein n=1 Tax=unclassified Mesorhizobium TaxID=325217 RepID=UPI0033383E2E